MEKNPETYQNIEEPHSLELDPKHPGFRDASYINRRKGFFDLARKHRLENLGLPKIDYTEEEHMVWNHISTQLKTAHEKSASELYLAGKDALKLETNYIPQLHDLDKRLREQHNMGLIPAEGLIDVRNFFAYLSSRLMPCTQFLRHSANPEYTPEPDAVHDVIGHVPPLMDKQYADLIQLIGKGVRTATLEQLQAWQRIYWFTIEFGLIEEAGELKIYGAGILSSFGEMDYCFSDKVVRKAFKLSDVINQNYDPTKMQDILYIIPSLEFLYEKIEILISHFSQ